MSKGVPGRPRDLRCAAQRVGILDHPVAMAVGLYDLAPLQSGKHVCCAHRLPGVWAKLLVQLGTEHLVGSHLALDAHGRNQVGLIQQLLEVGESKNEHSQHAIGAVY